MEHTPHRNEGLVPTLWSIRVHHIDVDLGTFICRKRVFDLAARLDLQLLDIGTGVDRGAGSDES